MALSILQVIASAERRGAETFGLALQGELERLGHAVMTVAAESGAHPELDVEAMGDRWADPKAIRRLRALMRAADVVIAHGSTALPASALAGLGVATPIVYRQISDPAQWTSTRARRLRVGLYLRRTDHVVALTDRTKSIVAERFRYSLDRITVIPNGADADRFVPADDSQRRAARSSYGLESDDFVVAWVGAFSAEKRPQMALDVAERLGNDWLVMAGTGPLQSAIASAAGDRVVMLGSVADTLTVYHAADALLLTSRTESLPAVLIEAGLCGLPCVAAGVGDVPSIVIDGSTGFVVGERAGEMADALRQLRSDPELRGRLGDRARSTNEKTFSMSMVGRQWSSLAASVAAGRR